MNTAGVSVIVIFPVVKVLRRKAATAQVAWDIGTIEIEGLVLILDEILRLLLLEANDVDNHMWHKRFSGCSIEGQRFLPVRVQKPEDKMIGW